MSTSVYYFGGYQATVSDTKAWIASAIKQKPSVFFLAYPYPAGASWDGEEAVKAFTRSKDLAVVTKIIEASTSDKVYIVGHSSGCAVANEVDANIKDHKKIVLVALDGYSPSDAQLARPSTQMWIAESGVGQSMHHDDLLDRIKNYNDGAKDKIKANIYTAASGCTTKLALHFSLVNSAANDAKVKHIPDGYTDCVANLAWLV